jgi:hypothetical protein
MHARRHRPGGPGLSAARTLPGGGGQRRDERRPGPGLTGTAATADPAGQELRLASVAKVIQVSNAAALRAAEEGSITGADRESARRHPAATICRVIPVARPPRRARRNCVGNAPG